MDTLKNSVLSKNLDEMEIAKVADCFGELAIDEGKAVFVENMTGETLYLIDEGTIQVSRMMAEGDERTLVILGPEDIFGEMALIDAGPRSVTARVAENARLLTLRRQDFESLCEQDPKLGLKLMRNIVQSFMRGLRDNEEEFRDMLRWSLGGNTKQGGRP